MNSLLILGAGGHSTVVAETAIATSQYGDIKFLDDDFDNPNLEHDVLGKLSFSLTNECIKSYKSAFVAIGDPVIRIKWIDRLVDFGYKIQTIIHPQSFISSSAKISYGSAVFANAAIQSKVNIGYGSIVNTSCSIDHHSTISSGVHICPGCSLAGNVFVGSNSIIGIGSSVVQGVTIGSNVVVGAGAAVVSDLPSNVLAIGVPASIKY